MNPSESRWNLSRFPPLKGWERRKGIRPFRERSGKGGKGSVGASARSATLAARKAARAAARALVGLLLAVLALLVRLVGRNRPENAPSVPPTTSGAPNALDASTGHGSGSPAAPLAPPSPSMPAPRRRPRWHDATRERLECPPAIASTFVAELHGSTPDTRKSAKSRRAALAHCPRTAKIARFPAVSRDPHWLDTPVRHPNHPERPHA